MEMESWLLKFIFVRCSIFLLLNATQCFSILQTRSDFGECSALFQFKESFTIDKSASRNLFAYPKVASWIREGDRNRSSCCSWDGVECEEEYGHVIGLDLSSSCLYGSLSSNSSLFQLVHLQRLDLSDNDFNFSEIPSRLGNELSSLTYLNLSQSLISGQIPSQVSQLSKLSTLDLSFNKMCHDCISHLLKLTKANLRSLAKNLTNIKQLHLSGVDIYSTVPNVLVNASSLTSLRLENCGLHGEFPVGIFHLPTLEVLNVNYNSDLKGYFPTFNKTNFFKKLEVGDTNFSGQLPTTIGNLHSLVRLGIWYCNFQPHVPSSFGNLSQLNYLHMTSFSKGQIIDSWSWVAKLTKLYSLGLGETNIKGKFPSFVSNRTRLEHLNLADNQISGQFPSWLMKFSKLTTLSLRNNKLQGAIPRLLFQLKNLQVLILHFNNLSGSVEFHQFSELKKLRDLRLSYNKLSLQIKTNLSATLPQFQVLWLGSCNLKELPEFLKNQYKLRDLRLDHNNIHGRIPIWLWNATRETLLTLDLSYNSLTGFDQNPINLPWQNLITLYLKSNKLQGSLPIPPPSIINYIVDHNYYSGEVSPSFCNLNELLVLDLSYNNLSGTLPQCLGNSNALEILILNDNSFHGSIPQICPAENSLKTVDLSYNQLQGKVPRSMANCIRLEFLNIGNNQISDIFPSWLGALPALRALSLRYNGFHGVIGKPATNHEFPKLCIIDLSNNRFSGMLPSNYMENWNSMKSVDKNRQTNFEVSSPVVNSYKYNVFYIFRFSFTTFTKGTELKYYAVPYIFRLIDFSRNRFEGEIPAGIIGNLRGLHSLNLSNNILTGLIPSSIVNLTALESLDLSQNQLSGRIPSNFVQLNFLARFNVSYNYLQGPVPVGQQFDTFLEDSYHGNSGLCGKLLSKKCEDSETSTSSSILEEDSGFQNALDWYVVLPGAISGLIVGVVAGNHWTSKKHEWFVETFSRKRQPRDTGGKRGHRN